MQHDSTSAGSSAVRRRDSDLDSGLGVQLDLAGVSGSPVRRASEPTGTNLRTRLSANAGSLPRRDAAALPVSTVLLSHVYISLVLDDHHFDVRVGQGTQSDDRRGQDGGTARGRRTRPEIYRPSTARCRQDTVTAHCDTGMAMTRFHLVTAVTLIHALMNDPKPNLPSLVE